MKNLILIVFCSVLSYSSLTAQSNFKEAVTIFQISSQQRGNSQFKKAKEARIELAKKIYKYSQVKYLPGKTKVPETEIDQLIIEDGDGIGMSQPEVDYAEDYEVAFGTSEAMEIRSTPPQTTSPIDKKRIEEEIANELQLIINIRDNSGKEICKCAQDPEKYKEIELKYLADINNYFSKIKSDAFNQGGARGTAANNGNDATGVFGISQAEIIQGIVEWSITRAKRELLQAFLQEWLYKVQSEKTLQTVFPNTLNLLKTSEITAVISQGDVWKSAFVQDFDNLPYHIPSLVSQIIDETKLDKIEKDELNGMLRTILAIYPELNKGKKLEEWLPILAKTIQLNLDKKSTSIIERGVVGINLLLQNVRTGQTHLTPSQIINLQDKEFKILWNLIFIRNYKKVGFIFSDALTEISCEDLYNKTINKVNALQLKMAEVSDIVTNIKELQELIKKVAAKENSPNFNEIHKYFLIAMDITDDAFGLANLIKEETSPGLIKKYKELIKPFAGRVMEINEGIGVKNYGKVVTNLIGIFDLFIANMSDDGAKEKYIKVVGYVHTYGKFMVNLLTAENKEEVKSALEDAAMKTGGYMVKQTSKRSLFVNVYPGASFGSENLMNQNNVFTDSNGNATNQSNGQYIGATLPIGVQWSWGTEEHGSNGIFFQFFDLGSVLSYSLNNADSLTINNDFGFKEVFSPGILYSHTFNKTPINLAAGITYTPDLIEFTQLGSTFQANSLRIGINLTVDVSVFTLYASKEKTKSNFDYHDF